MGRHQKKSLEDVSATLGSPQTPSDYKSWKRFSKLLSWTNLAQFRLTRSLKHNLPTSTFPRFVNKRSSNASQHQWGDQKTMKISSHLLFLDPTLWMDLCSKPSKQGSCSTKHLTWTISQEVHLGAFSPTLALSSPTQDSEKKKPMHYSAKWLLEPQKPSRNPLNLNTGSRLQNTGSASKKPKEDPHQPNNTRNSWIKSSKVPELKMLKPHSTTSLSSTKRSMQGKPMHPSGSSCANAKH